MRKRIVAVLTLLVVWSLQHVYWPSQMDSIFLAYGQSAGPIPGPNGTVTLNLFEPSFAAAGSAGITITLSGGNFVDGAVVYANEDPLNTQYVSPSTLTAFVPSSKLAVAGHFSLRVKSPGYGDSRSMEFTVLGAAKVSRMFPNSATPGTTFIARIDGSYLEVIQALNFTGSGVTATILRGSEPSLFPFVRVTIAADAPLGARSASAVSPYANTTTANLLNVVQRKVSSEPWQTPLPMPDVESGPTRTGYIVVACNGQYAPKVSAIMGMVHNGAAVSQTAVLGVVPNFSKTFFSADQLTAIGRSFGVAVVNTSDRANDVNITMVDERGTPRTSSTTLRLEKFGQTSRLLSELFPDASGPFQGSLQISSSQTFAAIGLKLYGATVSPVAGLSMIASSFWATPLNPELPSAAIVPQFALGGGWATQLNILNSTTEPMTGRVGFFAPDGTPMTVRMNGATQSTFSFSLPVAGTFIIAPRDANGQTPF